MKKTKAGKKGPNAKPAEREDGRRATLIYLKLDVLTQLQSAATHRRMHAYEIVEAALTEYLKNKTG